MTYKELLQRVQTQYLSMAKMLYNELILDDLVEHKIPQLTYLVNDEYFKKTGNKLYDVNVQHIDTYLYFKDVKVTTHIDENILKEVIENVVIEYGIYASWKLRNIILNRL